MRSTTLFLSGITPNSWWARLKTSSRPFPMLSAFRGIVSSPPRMHMEEFSGDFLSWLQKKAEAEISSVLSTGRSSYGRTLYANTDIKDGDILFKVPFSVQLSSENLPSEISSLLGDDVDDSSKVALLILLEKRLGKYSEWAPYLSCLPPPEDLHNTISWSNDELENIRVSGLYDKTIKEKAQIGKHFRSFQLVLDAFSDRIQRFNLEEFTHAYGLVNSRAWNGARGLCLIPFADFVNHDGNSESYLLFDEPNQHSEAIADRDFAMGDEVKIRYGKLSNADLLLDFGFSVADNKFDMVRIELDIPENDELYVRKSALLQIQHSTRCMKETSVGAPSWNSFILKEVRRGDIKGRGIPQSLRAFARVLICNSREELHELMVEAAQNDGRLARYPLRNTKEVAAHQFLVSKINHLIGEHEKHLELVVLNASPVSAKTALRRKLSENLLTGELRVLQSAVLWLLTYCKSLVGE